MYRAIHWCTQTHCALQHSPTSFINIIHIIITTNNVWYTSTCAIWEAAKYKENESLYYYLPLIPSIPGPTPAPNSHTRTHTHARTHARAREYETGSGWHVQKAWRKKCGFRLTLKVGREVWTNTYRQALESFLWSLGCHFVQCTKLTVSDSHKTFISSTKYASTSLGVSLCLMQK